MNIDKKREKIKFFIQFLLCIIFIRNITESISIISKNRRTIKEHNDINEYDSI